jgi:hypothetical protein
MCFTFTENNTMPQFKRILTMKRKGVRLWVVRAVTYDDSMTPMYASLLPREKKYNSLAELVQFNTWAKEAIDNPILDLDNNLRVYNDDEVCAVRRGL